jgi:hypothetical protein
MTVFPHIRFSLDTVGGSLVAAMVSEHEAIGLVSISFYFMRFAFVLSLFDLQGELLVQNLPPPPPSPTFYAVSRTPLCVPSSVSAPRFIPNSVRLQFSRFCTLSILVQSSICDFPPPPPPHSS